MAIRLEHKRHRNTAMSTATKDQTNTERLTLPVQGMSCAACVRRVEKALAGVDGVQDASVNLATEKATMVFDPAHVGIGAMKQAVEAAGYELVEPEVAPAEEADRIGLGAGSSRRGFDSAPPGQGDVRGAASRS